MKKIMTMLTTMVLIIAGLTLSAQAKENSINDAIFSNGKISTPNAPYVLYRDKNSDGSDREGNTFLYIDIPEDLLALNQELALLGEDEFNKKYNTPMNNGYHESIMTCIQVDVKFDDGPWLSESDNWDRMDYGSVLYPSNLNFRLDIGRYTDETSKLFSFEQSWLVYNEPEMEYNTFLQPYLKSFKDSYGQTLYQLDTDKHTFSYRIRFILYTNNWESFDEGAELYWCMSDWSPVVSIGKNGNQKSLEAPDKAEAPVLSDFSLIKNEENGVEAQYFVDFTKYTYDSIKYFSIIENYFEPFYIESQIRVDGGDWVDTYTANAASLHGGYRSTASDDVTITMDSKVEIRVRIVSPAMNDLTSEWSNIVGNTAEAEVTPKPTAAENPDITNVPEEKEPDAGKHKCKVCGICPIQPLGICLFIWLLIIVIVIVLVVIIITSKNKKDKDKDEKKTNRK